MLVDSLLTRGSGKKQYKMIDFGTAIRVRDAKKSVAGPEVNQSLMTFTQMKFAG